MHHPFESTISELEKVNFEIEKVSDEDLKKVSGGQLTIPPFRVTTQALGEEGGHHYLDFREDKIAELIPINTPETVQKQSIAITKVLLMEWTAIDLRLTPEGEYIFLEANPSPMFLHFERQTGFPITQTLIQLLMS